MAGRTDALVRIWALLWVSLLGYVLAIIVGLIAMIVGTLSVLLQLLFGREVIGSNSLGLGYFKRTINWTKNQTVYAITGSGSFAWLP